MTTDLCLCGRAPPCAHTPYVGTAYVRGRHDSAGKTTGEQITELVLAVDRAWHNQQHSAIGQI